MKAVLRGDEAEAVSGEGRTGSGVGGWWWWGAGEEGQQEEEAKQGEICIQVKNSFN